MRAVPASLHVVDDHETLGDRLLASASTERWSRSVSIRSGAGGGSGLARLDTAPSMTTQDRRGSLDPSPQARFPLPAGFAW
jgi:hypothetical protein